MRLHHLSAVTLLFAALFIWGAGALENWRPSHQVMCQTVARAACRVDDLLAPTPLKKPPEGGSGGR